jgi:hypothetical protein
LWPLAPKAATDDSDSRNQLPERATSRLITTRNNPMDVLSAQNLVKQPMHPWIGKAPGNRLLVAAFSEVRRCQVGNHPDTAHRLQEALGKAGIEFIEENGGGLGVRLKEITNPK